MSNYHGKTFISIALCVLNMAFHLQAMEQKSPCATTHCPREAPLMFHPVNREAFDFNKHTPIETYLGQLQQMASYLSFQNGLIKCVDWYNRTSLELLKQEKEVKELMPLISEINAAVGNLIDKQEAEDFIKTNLICIHLHHKLSQCQIPFMGEFKAFDFLSKLKQISGMAQKIFCPNNGRSFSNKQVSRYIQTIKRHLTAHFDRYFDTINQIIIDNQYREIIRMLRLEVSHAQKRPTDSFFAYLFDLYAERDVMERELRLLDYLLSDQDRNDIIRSILQPEPHQEEKPFLPPCTKSSKKVTKAKPMPKAAKPPCPRVTYSLDTAYEERNDNLVHIYDRDNEMIIHLNLNPEREDDTRPLSVFPAESLFTRYSNTIQSWFTNTAYKLNRSQYKKYSRPQKDRLIQQYRFSPLVDHYINAIGREYLDLAKNGKQMTTILDQPAHNESDGVTRLFHSPESCMAWLKHAERHGLQATIRIELDAQVHFLTTNEQRDCTFIYHIDPKTGIITYRFMQIDQSALPSIAK